MDLIDFIESGDLEAVKNAIAAGVEVDKWLFPRGITPLSIAVEAGCPEIVDVLLAAGADPNERNRDGTTALSFVRDPVIADLLILHGATVDREVPEHGETSVHCAAMAGDVRLLDALLKTSSDLRHVIDNFDWCFGMNPLSYAASSGHVEAVEFLLSLGADPNAAGEGERFLSPLQRALMSGHRNVARVLLRNGADPEFAPLNESPKALAVRQCIEWADLVG